MKTSSGDEYDNAERATSAPLLLFQPPHDDPAPMIPRSSAAKDADIDCEEHERNRAQAAEDEMAERREGNALYFLYGSLMDPPVLRRVLNLSEKAPAKASLHRWTSCQDVGTLSSSEGHKWSYEDSRQGDGV